MFNETLYIIFKKLNQISNYKNMSQELYYTPPKDEYFEDMKKVAIEIWRGYDDTYNYATDKINRIKDIKNIQDNFMYIFAMFDNINQATLILNISKETRDEIKLRLE